MQRRTFCRYSLAAAAGAFLPGNAANGSPLWSAGISAVSTSGAELTLESSAVAELADSLAGALILPDNSRYDSVRRVWNGMIDRHPAMIALCANDADVASAVTFAAERNLLLAVKGGGHSYPGKSSCDGGLVIDLSNLRDVLVDTAERRISAQGGALLAQLDIGATAHNLITTTGVVSHTGVGGFTLGGGMGRVDRKHGLAIDNLLGATLVTADGSIRQVSADNEPDLFWAIRGGGGNFGVVTRFTFRAHPFEPTVIAGNVTYPFDQAKTVLKSLLEAFESVPDACSIEPGFGVSPEGERYLYVQYCWTGDHAQGAEVLAPLRSIGKPLKDEVAQMSYVQLQTSADGYFAHGRLNYLKSGMLPRLTAAAVDAMVDSYEGDYLPDTWVQHLGGVTATVAPSATAYANRGVSMNYGISGVWDDPDESERRIAKIREIYAAIEPHTAGFYVNLHEDTAEKTRSNYGGNLARLQAIKQRFDPNNLFRLNANITPQG